MAPFLVSCTFSKRTCLSFTDICFYLKDHQEKSLLDTNKAQQVLDQGEFKDNDFQSLHRFFVLFLVFLHYKNLSNNQTEFHEFIPIPVLLFTIIQCIIQAVIALLGLIYCCIY